VDMMALKLEYDKFNDDSLEVFLQGVLSESDEIEKKMLKMAAERAKELVVSNLNKHRRILAKRYKDRPAMADDVKISIASDRWGDRSAKVMGGKKTGTLWHIVNDGNLYSTPTHFLDIALNQLDNEIDSIWDSVMK